MLTWQSIRSLFDAYLSQVLLAIGTITPIAYLVRIGINFDGAKYFYVGWSLVILCYILYRIFCPAIVSRFANSDEYYSHIIPLINKNKSDLDYEMSFLYDAKNAKNLPLIPECIDRMWTRTSDENITIFGKQKFLYYALRTKYELLNTSNVLARRVISIILYFAILLIQIPAIVAFWTIITRT